MKKQARLKDILGIKQDELAVLLKITRSQLSMYESGKRDLPVTAKIQLAEMLQYMLEDKSKQVGIATLLKAQAEHQKKVLEQLIQDNQYKQLLLEKKIKIAEKKYHSKISN